MFDSKSPRSLSKYEEATVVAVPTNASSESTGDLGFLFSLKMDAGGTPLSTSSFILSESEEGEVMLSTSEDFCTTLLTNV